MSSDKVIHFDSHRRLLDKAIDYLEDIEAFLSDIEHAVPLLLKVLKSEADDDLKQKIIMLLGGFARHQVAFPLFDLMCDASQSDEIRHTAAIQLSVTASLLEFPEALVERLLSQLNHPDPQHRANATFALGWEGNHRAAIALIGKLYDADPAVQQAAVNALSNLGDERILDLLIDRLQHGSLEQKRCIIYNLWRFHGQQERILQVYRRYIHHPDPELRFDALVLMSTMSETVQELDAYLDLLQDPDERVRRLALERLEELPRERLAEVAERLRPLADDISGKVRRTARRLLRRAGIG